MKKKISQKAIAFFATRYDWIECKGKFKIDVSTVLEIKVKLVLRIFSCSEVKLMSFSTMFYL